MKKITILALHLGYGGIEKCIANLANSLCHNYEVEIISTYQLYERPPFDINSKIKIKYLMNKGPNKKEIINLKNKHKYIKMVIELFKAMNILKLKKKLMIKEIKNSNSDIIISTRDIHNLWLSKYGKKETKKIGWEHNHHNNDQKYINKIVKSVKGLDYFILVSESLRDFYSQKLIDTKCKCVFIPNCLDDLPIEYSDLENKRIISVGRLSYEKGYDELIDVFKLINNKYNDWSLDIIGDGDQLELIKNKIKEYSLEDRITLHGFQNKKYINDYLKNSSIYLMTSRSESFGIVLLEAMSYGLPCVAFSRAVGASELITNNIDGYLIENDDKTFMYSKICELIESKELRIKMGKKGIEKSKNYTLKSISDKWIKVIER